MSTSPALSPTMSLTLSPTLSPFFLPTLSPSPPLHVFFLDEEVAAMERIVAGQDRELNFGFLAQLDRARLMIAMDTDLGKQCVRLAPWYAAGLTVLYALRTSEHWLALFWTENVTEAIMDAHDSTAACNLAHLLVHAITDVSDPSAERFGSLLMRTMNRMKVSARAHEIEHCMHIVLAIHRRNVCDFSSPVSDVLNWGLMNALAHNETRRTVAGFILEFKNDSIFEEEVKRRAVCDS